MYQKESLILSPEFAKNQDKHVPLAIFLDLVKKETELLLNNKERVFISLAGQSASGKSTISHKIQNLIKNAKILNMDNYLLGWSIGQLNHDPIQGKTPYFAGLNPAVYDLDRFESDLKRLKKGEVIDQPVFDELSKTIVGSEKFVPNQVNIIDGIYTLDERFIDFADLAYLVEAPLHDRLIRKILRNFYQHSEKVNPIIETYLTRDEPTYAFHQARLKKAADLVVSNPLKPQHEFNNLPKPEISIDNPLFNLVPKISTGNLNQGESILIDCDQNRFFFCYSLNNQLLVKEPITETAIELLSKYYLLT
jgi:uridine kinase